MTGLLRLLRRPAAGALAGQVTAALAGLVLQAAAARWLGAEGLAAFALAYGAIVLATAVCSGLVGDSLTVLDRHDAGIRAGLHVGTVVVCVVAGSAGAVLGLATDVLPLWAGLLLGLAAAAFIIEDTLRRLLMAAGRWWSLPVVDLAGLLVSLTVLVLSHATGGLTLASFVVALLAGQSAAAVVAWIAAPVGERPCGPWRRPDVRAVVGYGAWRAATQTVRPAALTLLRVFVVAGAGAAAYGPIEAARVYTAPTLVLVTGLGSFLLPHFVTLRRVSPSAGLRVADRAAAGLTAGVGLIGVLAVVLLPWLGPLLTGGDYAVPVVAVVGWVGYAAASAVLVPYAGLASANGGQRRVLALRLLEFGSLALVAPLLMVSAAGTVVWAPLILALGPALAAVVVRQLVVLPIVREQQPTPVREALPA